MNPGAGIDRMEHMGPQTTTMFARTINRSFQYTFIFKLVFIPRENKIHLSSESQRKNTFVSRWSKLATKILKQNQKLSRLQISTLYDQIKKILK
jgi:hypothetical protein